MTRLGLLLAMLAGFAATPVLASKSDADAAGTMTVQDDAHLFTEAGVNAAKEGFHATTFHGSVRFTVHTVKAIPESKKADFDAVKSDKNQLSRFVTDWARELARKEGSKADVFVLVLVNDKGAWQVKCIADRESSRFRSFEDQKADEVAHKFGDGFRAVKDKHLAGDQAKAEMSTALSNATNLVIETLRDTSVPTGKTASATHNDKSGKSNIMSYVCIGLCVLAGVWLVIGLIRAFTGGGGGGMGGGGGYGGGGGGFMSSLVGGMFGAMAGMWMYNNFFGGGMHDVGATDSYGGDGGAGDTGDGDYDGGASGGDAGGDWGDGGGDAGGGDWGGGDAGGGDWGGGGGDFGGGDW